MRKGPGFTAIAVVTLGLGIGANTAIFSVLRATLLSGLPLRDPGRLFLIVGSDETRRAIVGFPVSNGCYELLRDRSRTFGRGRRLCGDGYFTLDRRGNPERLDGGARHSQFLRRPGSSAVARPQLSTGRRQARRRRLGHHQPRALAAAIFGRPRCHRQAHFTRPAGLHDCGRNARGLCFSLPRHRPLGRQAVGISRPAAGPDPSGRRLRARDRDGSNRTSPANRPPRRPPSSSSSTGRSTPRIPMRARAAAST